MIYKRPRKLAMMLQLPLLLILTGCVGQTPTAGTDSAAAGAASFCQVARIIRFSRLQDTPQTIEQIKEHNAVWHKLCGPGVAP